MAYEFKMKRLVEFSDTDMAGIMHFANFFRFMEAAEHAFYRSLGFSADLEKALGRGWPRVRAECDYKRPLRFEDEVEIHLRVRQIGRTSIRYEFVFRKSGAQEEVARGGLTIVCVTRDPKTNQMKAAPLPQVVREKIQTAPQEVFQEGEIE